jgi:hypothetical protein
MPAGFDQDVARVGAELDQLKPTRCGRWIEPRSIVKDRSIPRGS